MNLVKKRHQTPIGFRIFKYSKLDFYELNGEILNFGICLNPVSLKKFKFEVEDQLIVLLAN